MLLSLVVLLLAATRRYWGTGPAGESDRWIRVRGDGKFGKNRDTSAE